MGFPELYILRHGETEWNAEGRMQGRLHSALTVKGIAQAQTQGDILSGRDLDGFEVISSPQTRALHTAVEVFSRKVAMISTDARLCEVDVGQWQGRIRDELQISGDPKATEDGPLAFYEQAEGGEGFAALRLRCSEFLTSLDGPKVLVTHGITSRMLRAVYLGLDDDALVTLPGGQGVVYHLCDGVQTALK